MNACALWARRIARLESPSVRDAYVRIRLARPQRIALVRILNAAHAAHGAACRTATA